jgi:predicted small secreted protein
MHRTLPRAALTLLVLLSLAACDTVAGAGKDLQKAGSAITTEANKTAQKM